MKFHLMGNITILKKTLIEKIFVIVQHSFKLYIILKNFESNHAFIILCVSSEKG